MKLKLIGNLKFNIMKYIPTAEEFAKSVFKEEVISWVTKERMIEYTKLHVTAALEAAHSNMHLPQGGLEFTLLTYPLTQII